MVAKEKWTGGGGGERETRQRERGRDRQRERDVPDHIVDFAFTVKPHPSK